MDKTLQIVLAEDNEADAFLVRMALEQAGLTFNLQICLDGEDALRSVDGIRREVGVCPDLFLLDLNLPKIDGEKVLMALRGVEQCYSTPVIIITSSGNPADRNRLLACGATTYFTKPLDLQQFMELGTIVRDLLRK